VITFINNDLTFKLSDNTVNDGYLLDDGIHLNNRGTNRLAKNMRLKIDPKTVNGCVAKQRWHDHQPREREQNTQKSKARNANWQKVNNRRSSRGQSEMDYRRRRDLHDTHRPNEDGKTVDNRKCWYCGENNHVSRNCRHGRKISCHNCQELGHKARDCTY